MERYWRGEQRLTTIAQQCDVKSRQSDRVADAVNNLRDRLTDIARSGNEEIDRILSGTGSPESKVTAVNEVIAEKNASAAHAAGIAMSNIVDATQRVLDATIGGDARKWLRDHGVNLDGPPPSRPITAEDLNAPSESSAPGFGAGQLNPASGPAGAGDAPVSPAASGHGAGQVPVVPATADASDQLVRPPKAALGPGQVPTSPPPGPVAPPVPQGAPAIGLGGPSVPGVSAPAASAPQLSPQSFGQSVATGMTMGAPAAAGSQSLSAGVMNAAATPATQAEPAIAPPTAPMAAAPPIATGVAGVPHIADPSASAPAPAPAVSPAPTNAMTTVSPMFAGGPGTGSVAPVVGSAPVGPLPAYGSDLRPPAVAAPAPSSVPTGPVSGAAVAASSSSSPSAGGAVVSPAAKADAHTAVQAQSASSSSQVASATVAATAGAATGDSGNRAVEQQRLRHIVDAVARQEPGLSWAAGLRDGGRITLLVTDLACGWIPPHVRLPAHVMLLEPAARRRDASAVDLLGAVTLAAVYQPHGYIGEPGPDTPALTGDRTARVTPQIDEFGPTLAEAVRRRDGLPRIAQAVAVAAARKYGVPDNEVEMLHETAAEICRSVLAAYPDHEYASTVDWMLLAAINALIDGDQTRANYHLAWAIAATSMRRCA
ncbi:hypothetical protein LAUMK4_03003 [Mycobacterium persicum]|uniref:Transmembrane protein n=3 Tax=Mycobacterium persicum TaxID=1487726 RepID=A0ABY6RJK7_9MYCO|nr:hypothetical protein LAUMK15_03329 [Mycobacterium persicum]VAZ95021.1 hypothetical protein LAUMK4_03003 [Mycobacterium persicum]